MELKKKGELNKAEKIVILLHGRGATAEGILELTEKLSEACYIAPQAPGRTWYPQSFMAPRKQNQPELKKALETLSQTVEKASEHVENEKIILLGFSQGACLASEYIAKNATKNNLGGLIVFSGGLIGERIESFSGDLDKMPVFIGCSEKDPHIPLERVNETAEVFKQLNAEVEKYIMEGSSHGIDGYELDQAYKIINNV